MNKKLKGTAKHTVRYAHVRMAHIQYRVGAVTGLAPSVYSTHVGHGDARQARTTCVRGSYGTVLVPPINPHYLDDCTEDDT